jgi:hypothetical protein
MQDAPAHRRPQDEPLRLGLDPLWETYVCVSIDMILRVFRDQDGGTEAGGGRRGHGQVDYDNGVLTLASGRPISYRTPRARSPAQMPAQPRAAHPTPLDPQLGPSARRRGLRRGQGTVPADTRRRLGLAQLRDVERRPGAVVLQSSARALLDRVRSRIAVDLARFCIGCGAGLRHRSPAPSRVLSRAHAVAGPMRAVEARCPTRAPTSRGWTPLALHGCPAGDSPIPLQLCCVPPTAALYRTAPAPPCSAAGLIQAQ